MIQFEPVVNFQQGQPMTDSTQDQAHSSLKRAFARHERTWRDFELVYPVVSRRSRGVSIGINLNPDRICNYNCLYCCVNRSQPLRAHTPSLDQLDRELNGLLESVLTGALAEDPLFSGIPEGYRRLRDLAFSGDGEPTISPVFESAVDRVIRAHRHWGLDGVKIVLITNATRLSRPEVERALSRLDEHGGEVWAKLDAGSEAFFELIDQPGVSLRWVLDEIARCANRRAVVIQTMVARVEGAVPADDEWRQWASRLVEIRQRGGVIARIQLYTVARVVHDSRISAASESELGRIARIARDAMPDMPVEVFAGVE
ncbi:MAG: radical SAM protein [Phycisphaeraceae bacterium]|nr:radical SAM protein [Phycisphaeraceae bacterium]